MTNHANMAGIIHCIMVFIWRCCSLLPVLARLLEMRCWSHMATNTIATRM